MIKNAVEYIQSIPPFTYPLGNGNLKRLLGKLGNPQNGMRFIHIAGTNGKGSAAAMTAEILIRQGYRVGVFTSPYLICFNERIRINHTNIPDGELGEIAECVKNAMEETDAAVSQFAFITACAFLYYKKENVDFVVLEAGMGGRLDATNVIEESFVSVIMSVGLDHTDYLGSTKEEIAAEKCGIIKNGGCVVAYRNCDGVNAVIKDIADKNNAKLYFADFSVPCEGGAVINGIEYKLSLEGVFQARNAAVVLKITECLKEKGVVISDKAITEGLSGCVWRARFERVADNLIVDGGHNPDGVAAMCESARKIKGKKLAVVAMMEDKDTYDCMKLIKDSFDRIIITELPMPRCMRAEKLCEIADDADKTEIITDMHKAFNIAQRYLDGTAIVCGSIYLAGEALKYYGK